nr:unnamed protein product [Digitaria exilis]
MEADTGNPLAVDEAISFVRDLEGVLRASNDGDASAHTGAGARMLLSACRSDSDDLELQIRDIVDKSGKKIEKFEFEKTMPPAEICDRLWKKI